MSTEKMRKLMMLAETMDGVCPHCHGWGEYIDPEGFDEPVHCPHCDEDDEPIRKSRLVKDMAMDMDMDWTDLGLSDVEPEDLKGFPKVNESFTRKHFQMVADTLQKIEDPEVRRAQAEEYAQQFAAANPRFRRDLFMKAAGVLEENDVVQTPGAKHLASLKNKKTPDPEDMGDTEVGYDDGYGDADTDHYGYDESVGELDEVQTLPREIKDRKPTFPDLGDLEYETCPECGVEGGHENGCAVLGALYNEDLNEEQSEFRLKDIVGADNFAELVSDLNTGGIDYSAAYFTPLYWHFLDEYPDEIPVGSRTGRPEDPEEYVLDNLERYHSEEIKSYMNTPDMDESNCGVCGETFKWEGSPDEEMCPRCTQEYLGEDGDSDKGKPYICVHVKKGKHECYADTSYGAAKKAAEHWGLKSTAGIDAHLAIDEASCPCGKEGCECGPDCDCEPVEEGFSLDSIVESLLDERGQPKDYEMSDDELASEIEDETSEFERDHIDKEIEDEELGLRFD